MGERHTDLHCPTDGTHYFNNPTTRSHICQLY